MSLGARTILISGLLLGLTVAAAFGADDAPETISAKCPGRWVTTRADHGKHGAAWLYECEPTGVTIACPDGPHGCGLRGTTKGDKSASWTK